MDQSLIPAPQGEGGRAKRGRVGIGEPAMTPPRLAEFIIGRRFAPTRWLADPPLSGEGQEEHTPPYSFTAPVIADT